MKYELGLAPELATNFNGVDGIIAQPLFPLVRSLSPSEVAHTAYSARRRSEIRFAVCRCLAGWLLSSSRMASITPSHGPNLGRFAGSLRR